MPTPANHPAEAGDLPRRPLRIAIAGASGLVGAALADRLASEGHIVSRLVRRPPDSPQCEIPWDPARGRLDPAALEGFDAAINLCGENIAGGRWTAARKEDIRTSRVASTRLLSETLARLGKPPRVLISASATGYYGDRGAEELTESSPPGAGFLPDVCIEWERAAQPAAGAGVRVVNLRIGVVLTPRGGALAKMLTPFRLGLGGVVGSGRQYMSWVGLTDLLRAVNFVIVDETLSGPVNAVAPRPVTNREFTKALGRVLRRPTLVPAPGLLVRAALGEMGQRLLLEGNRVLPARLLAAGFVFATPEIEGALRAELGVSFRGTS